MTKHRSFRDFKTDLTELDKKDYLHLFVFGSCEYLSNIALEQFKRGCALKGISTVYSLEASSVDESQWVSMLDQPAFFEPASLFVLRRSEQAKSLPKLMQTVHSAVSSSNRVCFLFGNDNPPTAIKSILSKVESIFSVSCSEPWPNEVPAIVKEMAQELSLDLTRDAIELLIAASGTNLSTLSNEIRKLQLIFSQESGPLAAKTIAPHLGMLREDDAFELANLLLTKQWSKAQALAGSLLQRGESALALIGIIANHCRNAVKIATGAQPSEFRLPPSVYKNYKRAYDRQDPAIFAKALERCRQVDMLLKSSPLSDELLLTSLIDSLS